MNPLGQYGSMILTKHPCNFYEKVFSQSTMSRSLLFAEPVHGIGGRNVVIATSHFESLNFADVRKI